jgi:soluble lytic murein transglycosylase-like protein
MATLKIPATNLKFYESKQVPAIKNRVTDVIEAKYGNIIKNVSKITGLNEEIIKSFIFIESAGKENAETPYAIGLMQVGLATASDGLVYEKSSGRLGKEEEDILKKYLGGKMKNLENLKKNQKSIGKTWIGKKELFNPELNILIGSIIIKQLADEFTENGVPRLDKVAVIYNAGRYGKIAKKTINHKGSVEDLVSILPKEPSAYITKLVGTNGLLDILI